MIRTKALVVILACAAQTFLTGCNLAPALARVSEILMETSNGGNTTRYTVEVTYTDEGRVEEIESERNGDFTARYEYTYEEGRLLEIEINEDGSEARTLDVEWTGNQITEMTGSFNDFTQDIDLEYLDDDASTLSEYRSEVTGGGYVSRSETSFDYDDRRRVVEMRAESSAEFGGQVISPSTNEWQIEYGDDGRPLLVEITSTSGDNTDSSEAEFSYDDSGRLEEVDVDDGTDVSVTYNDQGLVEELELRQGGTTTTVEYVYEDGSTDGFAFLLEGAGGFFDLAGRHLERPYVYSTSFIPTP